MTPLSKIQKREIAIAAHAAWLASPDREPLLEVNPEMSKTAVEEAWRHVEQGKAVGIQSLRACTQAHYGRLLAHFQGLAGNTAGAQRTRARDQDNDRRIARWKLDQALRERGLQVGYAAAICRSKYKKPLDEATAGQLWKLVFDVRSRRKAGAAKAAPAATDGNPF